MANHEPTSVEPDDAEQVDEPVHDQAPSKRRPGADHWQRFKTWYIDRKKWTIPASAVLFILVLVAVPFTRYHLAGLVLKQDLTVKVIDSTANTPVSGAQVSLGSASGQTDGTGKVTLHHVKVGKHAVAFTKKYYKDSQASLLVPILKPKGVPQVSMAATGRQVKITVTNLINKKTLSDVDIKVADITAKTDSQGNAIVVLPPGVSEQKATLSSDGYNDAAVIVKVSNDKIQDNPFTLTPAGKVYFLSKLSGKIDVVKTNLDGTSRQTVLAGTGHEEDTNTVLLASRDWKYLALLSRRAGSTASLYLIDTSNDSLTTIDSGDATFNLTGWNGDKFIYTVVRNNFSPTQKNGEALKSFDAPSNNLAILDQTDAAGNDNNDYAHESYENQVYLIGQGVIYVKTWVTYQSIYTNDPTLWQNKHDGIYSIGADGKNTQTLKTFDIASDKYVNINPLVDSATELYFQVTDPSGTSYFAYVNGKVIDKDDLSDDYNNYESITYLQSPSGKNTFWSEPRDGKNSLLIGDQDGSSGKQIASLSDYSPYGWYTDNYLLVSKNSSELYVMPQDGSKAPIKVSDYHKPARTFNGYGGGYGGL